ncbi:N-acetylglucosaminyl-diphospho-decaprenol L-rhamnosyltransferase [Actinophytocola oryzae]|uniref:N-acetylglucosaminyl-diphospho-decaprenol L-rhamnosyltransferase n=1 Tax=Actinophytocola oryzae TaxID=502181 RepID=A0A4R7V462_9PSEU|nr:N-acetylglucosaminyl-diphospho-decaprenol L-rhamnosyltransferase [Actinophytocola oryzae]
MVGSGEVLVGVIVCGIRAPYRARAPAGARLVTVRTLGRVTVPVAVDCVVVSYNSADDLPLCLRSLADQTGVEVVVTVVDNCSSDDSVAVAQAHGARVLANTSNRGFAAAVNQGLRGGASPWVLILNPDARLAPGGVRALMDATSRGGRVGCVGPRTTDVEGTVYPSARAFPGVFTALVHGLLGRVWPGNPATRRYHAGHLAGDVTGEVDWVSGCCMLLPRAAWEQVGGFDERYFMYVEDMDLCFRLRQVGWRTVFEPGATVVHVGGRSSRRRPLRSIYHHHRGAIRFYWRSAAPWHRPVTGPLATLVLVIRGVVLGVLTAVSSRR